MFNRLKFCGTETACDEAVYTSSAFRFYMSQNRNKIFLSSFPVGPDSVFQFSVSLAKIELAQ